ncbi:MAG: AAA family ATPase [Candidatus Promineifilaceae bacterium]
MALFQQARQKAIEQESPLANRMRPRSLDEFVGQEHILGPGRLLRRAIQADQLSSLIFYGPPGTGKTTLARVIANTTQSHFITINAVLAGVAQIREAIAEAVERRDLYGQRTILFVDEVHRWNKAQQDALLPHVENGTIILVGATTENPYFEVNKALVSRSRIFQLKPLSQAELAQIAEQALRDPERGYGALDVEVAPEALAHLVDVANGDARGVLNALELAVETTPADAGGRITVDLAVAEESIQRRAVLYDKEGDVHYDTISAFIKSLRGSDPDAALYWMARMVYAGEDPRFIFRRMAILAGEDVGLADPNAAVVVAACWELFERIGMPEGRFPLAEAALYLATCPKSNSSMAFFDALAAVGKEQEPDVPNALRDSSRDEKGFGHGQGYLYPHAYRDHWVAQQYLPDSLQGRLFYQPGDQGYEAAIRDQVGRRREEQLAALVEGEPAPEILTAGPANRGRDAWLQRVVANSARNLGQVRHRLFELAPLQRHHLVLDVHAGSGLLTWEALRQAPEGGVWALTADAEAGEALREQAAGRPELERPAVLIGRLDELQALLALRGEADVRFDCVLGRNLLTARPAVLDGAASPKLAALGGLLAWLRPGGRLCFAQVVPRHGQRPADLVNWTGVDKRLAHKVRAAEDAIFEATADPLLAWDTADLAAALEAAGFAQVTAGTGTLVEVRRLDSAQVERWFPAAESAGAASGRPNYGERLAGAGLSPAEVGRVAQLFRQQLPGREVEWHTAVAYLAGRA